MKSQIGRRCPCNIRLLVQPMLLVSNFQKKASVEHLMFFPTSSITYVLRSSQYVSGFLLCSAMDVKTNFYRRSFQRTVHFSKTPQGNFEGWATLVRCLKKKIMKCTIPTRFFEQWYQKEPYSAWEQNSCSYQAYAVDYSRLHYGFGWVKGKAHQRPLYAISG